MDVERLLTTISERIKTTASVELVFGEPKVIAGRTIVPVASVAYGFGAGGGIQGKPGEEGPEPAASGGGGGGGVRVKPLAILEVTESQTRLVPVFDVNRLAFFALLGFVFALLLSRKRSK